MTCFYHISRGYDESELVTNFDKNKPVFFALKDSFWNKIEKQIALEGYGGYREYEILVPDEQFVEELSINNLNKIYKVTDDNKEEFKIFLTNFMRTDTGHIDRDNLISELKNKGFLGVDTHSVNINNIDKELIFFDFTGFLPNLKLVDTQKESNFTLQN